MQENSVGKSHGGEAGTLRDLLTAFSLFSLLAVKSLFEEKKCLDQVCVTKATRVRKSRDKRCGPDHFEVCVMS